MVPLDVVEPWRSFCESIVVRFANHRLQVQFRSAMLSFIAGRRPHGGAEESNRACVSGPGGSRVVRAARGSPAAMLHDRPSDPGDGKVYSIWAGRRERRRLVPGGTARGSLPSRGDGWGTAKRARMS